MAFQNIKLQKTIFPRKSTNDLIDNSFKDLIKPKKPKNIKKFFDVYEEIFSELPDNGEKSHHRLINQSTEYLNNGIDELDKQLDVLYDKIEIIENEIRDKDPTTKKEHIFYQNNTLLRTHGWEIEVVDEIPQGLPIWIMQEGSKREFKNYETYKTIKKALGFDLDTPDLEICEFVSVGELNKIPTGLDINEDADLNRLVGEDREIDYELADIVDFYSAKITCLEGSDVDPNAFSNSEYESRYPMCRIKHYNLSGQIRRRDFDPGETIQVYYRKNDPYTPGMNDGMVYREGYMREDYSHPEGTPSIYFDDPRDWFSGPVIPWSEGQILESLPRRPYHDVYKGELGSWSSGTSMPGRRQRYIYSPQAQYWYQEEKDPETNKSLEPRSYIKTHHAVNEALNDKFNYVDLEWYSNRGDRNNEDDQDY